MRGEMSWYVARAGGFLAWGLSAFSILWGLLISSRALGKRISGPRLLDLHRFVGGLSVVFVLVHVLALRLHEFEDLDFSFKELLVPMASDWHPGAVAYGIVAFYLLIAVVKLAFKLLALGIVVALGIGVYLAARRMLGSS